MCAWTEIQLGPACRAQPLAVVTAQRVAWNVQQPLLAHRRPEIEVGRPVIEQKYIRIIFHALRPRFREDEVRLIGDNAFRVAQTAAARECHDSINRTVPVEPARARRRQPPR